MKRFFKETITIPLWATIVILIGDTCYIIENIVDLFK